MVVDGAADHELDDPPDAELGDGPGPDRVAVAHDRDLVADPEELVDPVGDVDHRDARVGQAPHDAEEDVDLGVGEDRRRLVEDEHLGVAGERLGDGDLLLLGDGQVAHRPGRVALREAEQAEQLEDLLVLPGPVDPAARDDLAADEDVLGDGQLGEELRLLVDGLDAVGHRLLGGGEVHRGALEGHRPRVGRLGAGDDLDQRRLAGAVLADDGVDGARQDLELGVPDRPHAAIPLGDVPQLEPGFHVSSVGSGAGQ